ncbi:type II toxin-antitoxin system RelE/ParE family toxin [Dyadobacter sandarakinus]|uniref:Type II toxin-antitoxin system RelE/ParE family toxin n=1 Tax=Dyadobacter sandarakinus TaxID=2747268 RepID=A0ABX7I5G8_9BACT|nr:type II toxin-antitoxin system RelE/ParE family toxin [Dyadobacter sandarakinus]QRR01190.1 type II toxin-antitoxin system RelE/ParE family toxin [Dyadobacter sandarakinus]
MDKIREVVAFGPYFEAFLSAQPVKVQDKIFKVINAIETLQRVPANCLKHIAGAQGLYEVRIQLGSDIWRIFCFFENERMVILLTGFQKKTQKTPRCEIDRVVKLMNDFHRLKDQSGWK